MSRLQKLKMNTMSSLLNRVVIISSGFILPRLILTYFGSETNGLIASINQFLKVITFLDLGVGTVVQSALYKPLAEKDNDQISVVLSSAKKYFRNISYILLLYVISLVFMYPLIVDSSVDFISTTLLISAISINLFSQYFFGIINEFLLNADQRSYVQYGAETLVVFLNLVISVVLIVQGYSMVTVKIMAGLVYLIRPIYLNYYVNKNYNISKNVVIKEEPLKQKRNGMAQHIAWTIQSSTDIIIITIFSNLQNVSIYIIHHMVVNGISMLTQAFTNNLKAYLGNTYATESLSTTNRIFDQIEWLVHTLVSVMFTMTAVLIVPFVSLYTSGIEDVNYHSPVFAVVLTVSQMINLIRTPYQDMIFAAGHFRETQKSSFIEVVINLILSLLLVKPFGIIGVAVGSVSAMLYRTFYLVFYLSKNILKRSSNSFIKLFIMDIVNFAMSFAIGLIFNRMITVESIPHWIILASIVGVVSITIQVILNFFFYRENLKFVAKRIFNR